MERDVYFHWDNYPGHTSDAGYVIRQYTLYLQNRSRIINNIHTRRNKRIENTKVVKQTSPCYLSTGRQKKQ